MYVHRARVRESTDGHKSTISEYSRPPSIVMLRFVRPSDVVHYNLSLSKVVFVTPSRVVLPISMQRFAPIDTDTHHQELIKRAGQSL